MGQRGKFSIMDSKNSLDSPWRIGYNRITQLKETYLKVKLSCNSHGTNSLRIMGPPIQDKSCPTWDTVFHDPEFYISEV